MRPRPLRHRRLLARALTCAVVAGAIAATSSPAASTSTSTVGATIPGSTSLDTVGCPPLDANRTSFGTVVANASVVTSVDCDVAFGSSNATATLRTFRASPRAAAMAAPTTAVTDAQASGRVFEIEMIDASNGWLTLGDDAAGRIFSTSDGGVTWTTNAAGNTAFGGGNGYAVSAASTSVVWATRYANRRVIATANGGTSWTSSDLPGTSPRGLAIFAMNATTAYATGYDDTGTKDPRIWKTTNTGSTWTTQLTEADTVSQPTDITFEPGGTVGYMTTQNGDIWRTTDGTNWSITMSTGNGITSISAPTAARAMAVGSSGDVYVTSDGGATWQARDIPEDINLQTVTYRSSGVAWAAGFEGVLMRTTDHGLTWTSYTNSFETGQFSTIDSVSDTSIVAGSYGNMVTRSTDTAATWTRSASLTPGTNWKSIDGIDGMNVWRVGSGGRIDYTSDGSTWSTQASGTTNGLHGVAALDRQTAIVVGTGGTILRTTDAGATWTPVTSGTSATLRDVSTTPAGHVWIVGDAGTALRSTNGGVSFVPVASGVTTMLSAVTSLSDSTVLVGTGTGTIRRTTDAGSSWSTVASPSGYWVFALDGIRDTNVAWAVQGNQLARSTDAGDTWSSVFLGSGQYGSDLDAIDTQVAWASGRYGLVKRTIDGGGTWTDVSGYTGTRTAHAVMALGRDDAYVAGGAESSARVQPGTGVPDYGDAGATWAGAAGLFGICLRAAPSTTSTWPTTGSCTTSDGTNWRGLPDHGGAAEASTATTTAPGTTTASFRFGMKVPASLPSDTYYADLTFEVVSP